VEEQKFDIALRLGETATETAQHFISAVDCLFASVRSSFSALPLAVADREASLVQCISRVFTMSAMQEKLFWENVKRRANFLKEHECRISNIDVHFLTTTSSATATDIGEDKNSNNNNIGWCESHADGEKVTIDNVTLANPAKFDDWLEDIVAQCTLSRQAHLLTQRFSLFYVSRERNVLLPHYISFLNRYIDSSARCVIEMNFSNSNNNKNNASSTTIRMPIELIVGHQLDIKSDGSLIVPWDFDLSLLVSLLRDGKPKESRILTE
jgi:hypothetical protein